MEIQLSYFLYANLCELSCELSRRILKLRDEHD